MLRQVTTVQAMLLWPRSEKMGALCQGPGMVGVYVENLSKLMEATATILDQVVKKYERFYFKYFPIHILIFEKT
jgi:hypothetical protein